MVHRQAVDDRGLDEVAMRAFPVGQPPASRQNGAAVSLRLADGPLVCADGILVDHGTEVDVTAQWITDRDLLGFLDEKAHELVADPPADIHA